MDTLILNGTNLTIDNLREVAFLNRPVELDKDAVERSRRSRQVLFDMAAQGHPVYGLNRGWDGTKTRNSTRTSSNDTTAIC